MHDILNREAVYESGAKRSERVPPYGYNPGYAEDLVALRFEHGHYKYDKDDKGEITEVYSEANWLKAVRGRDVPFVRQLFTHARKHLKLEERGVDDLDAGGNLGAVGWAIEILAFVKKEDPDLYDAARGLRQL